MPEPAITLEPLDVSHTAALRALHQQPGVGKWWGPMEDGFPFDEPESARFTVVVGGAVAGLVQCGEETWPDYRHASIDIFIGDDFVGRGIGTDVIRRMVRMLVEERG